MTLIRLLTAALVATAALTGQAQTGTKPGKVAIGQPWARSTVPGQTAGGGFLTLQSVGGDDRLLGASAAVAQTVELHTMSMDGNVMRMRRVEAIDLPAGKTVELKPGGLHVMFMGLKAPLGEGDTFALRLRFEKAGEVTVNVKVQAAGAAAPETHKH
jgi:copper(I)-binding protein